MLVRTTDAVYEIEDGFFRREGADAAETGWHAFDAKAEVTVGRPLRFYWAEPPASAAVRVWSSTPVVEILATV